MARGVENVARGVGNDFRGVGIVGLLPDRLVEYGPSAPFLGPGEWKCVPGEWEMMPGEWESWIKRHLWEPILYLLLCFGPALGALGPFSLPPLY